MTWTLILTLYASAVYSKGAAIGAVNGFDSEAACIAAANAWRKQMAAEVAGNLTTLCVPSTIRR